MLHSLSSGRSQRHRAARWRLALVPALVCLLGLVLWSPLPLAAQGGGVMTYGDVVTGDVTSRLGDEWVFAGCLGEVVTITLQSDEFGGLIELYGPVGRRSLIAARGEGPGAPALIRNFTLPTSGEYTVIATGSSIQDRGPYTLVLESATQPATTTRQLAGTVAAGEVVTRVITSRLAEEWSYRGCQADVMSITLQSDEFTPYLEVFAPPRAPTATAESLVQVTGVGDQASVTGLVLPASGEYIIAAAGAGIRDRGEYILTLELLARGEVTATTTPDGDGAGATPSAPTATPTPQPPTATPRPPTATPTRTPQSGGNQPNCVVRVNTLNLRTGPGLSYDPPIGALARDTVLVPLQRNPNTSWVRVQVVGGGPTGWVSAGSQYLACNINLFHLPLGVIPPTYTPTATPNYTPTYTSTPTWTPPPGSTPTYTPTPTWTPDGTATDTPTPTWTPDSTPTDTPTPTWTPDSTSTDTPTPTWTPEWTPTYTPTPTWTPEWTPTNTPTPTSTTMALYGAIVATGANNNNDTIMGAMSFRVAASDPNVGTSDGDGIDWVRLQVRYGGNTVHERQENTAGYCAFSGGEPDCNIWFFDDNSNQWPSGASIATGPHLLRARIRADSGQEMLVERQITINNN